jgi:hypothetical protein
MAVRNSILVLLTASTIILPPCFADTSSASPDSSSAPFSGSAPSASSTQTDNSSAPAGVDSGKKQPARLNPPDPSSLQGNIQGGAPVVLQGLHDVGVTVHHLQEMLKGLLYEAQRQDMVVVSEPEVIGPIVMPVIPNPSGMMSMGYLPPRKKWVDYFMSQIEEIIPMLDHEINSLPRPGGTEPEEQQAFIELFDAARGFNPPWSGLETATKGPDYKNEDISSAGSGLWFQVEKFKKLKDKLFKLVKEETKQKKQK